jgi:hypothetical protein
MADMTLAEASKRIDELQESMVEVAQGLVSLSQQTITNTQAITKLVEIVNKPKIVRV